jgi:hypothetical protein
MLAEQRSNVEAGVAAKLEELMGEANDMLRDCAYYSSAFCA